MPRKSTKPKLHLEGQQIQYLTKIAQSRTAPRREVERAQILLKYYKGESIPTISIGLHISRETIYKHINKALAMGPEAALKDKYHSPKTPIITKDAKMWVVNLACTKPKDHGYAEEIWSLRLLAKHTRTYAPQEGHDSLKKASKATIHRILKEQPIQPHKIKYYLERRDPEFDRKMRDILMVYRDVNMQQGNEPQRLITISVDEKPGVQAIKNTAPDLPPRPGKHSQIQRDNEYQRLGTLSILAALDLHTGHIIGQVHARHRSREFISLLQASDVFYPPDATIRIILDNHSSHISKETMNYLASRPNRFIYVHTPKHGSWLNIIESLFSKMARTFLKYIRVQSKEELRVRILKWFEEVNEAPVVHRWKNFSFNNCNLSGF